MIKILSIIFLLISQVSLAQYKYYNETLELKQAFDNVFALEFGENIDILKKAKQTESKNAFYFLVENYNICLKLLTKDSKKYFDANMDFEDEILDQLDKIPNSTEKSFVKNEIQIQWGVMKMIFGHEISGAFQLSGCVKPLENLKKKDPNFIPLYKSLGLLHIALGSMPDNYKSFASILGFQGNVKLGIEELNKVINSKSVMKQEAQLILAYINNFLLHNEELGLKICEETYHNNPQNVMAGFLTSALHLKNGTVEQTIELLKNIDSHKLPYKNWILAICMLSKGEYKSSIEYSHLFQEQYKGDNYGKSVNMILSECYLLLGKNNLAQYHASLILKAKNEKLDVDKVAQKYAQNFKIINRDLLEIRVEIDGGYFEKAEYNINNFNIAQLNTLIDKTDFIYRKARLYHKTNRIDLAIEYYKKTIVSQQKKSFYQAPNSCYQLGLIYQKLKQNDLAIYYFKKVLTYSDFEYEGAIKQKANRELKNEI